MTYVPGTWLRCGNTLFYKKAFPHTTVGYTHIDPANLVRVSWEETPEGYAVERLEVPADMDWASVELVRFAVQNLPEELQARFWSWTNVLDILKRKGDSPTVIVGHFHHGHDRRQRDQVLDALDQGVFAADIAWHRTRRTVQTKEALDWALADLDVLECP